MNFGGAAKLLISKYYPHDHLVLASALSLLLAVTLMFAPEESAHGDRINYATPLDASIVAAPTPKPVHVDQTPWTEHEVQAGDNLSAIFTKVGLDAQDMYRVLNSNEEAQVLNKLYPGYQLSFNISEPGTLSQLKVLKSPIDGYLFTLNDDAYQVEPIQRTPEIIETFKEGVINDSLFMAGQKADIPAVSIMEMADIFGGVIDFILDPREGDSFSIVYEEKHLDGEFIGNGEIIAAQFTNQGSQYTAFRYESADGEVGYYNPDGESMRKAFLRTPLDVFRISSNFNLSRKHPILNTIRAHRGTDYAAPRGTPVRATSDGVVTWAARNGSFGKLIVIQHNGQFETKYAHLNDYAQGLKKGSRVSQGEVIGYVGTTGGSTGPHLHYEFLVNGEHKDPAKILDQMPKANSVDPSELPRFRSHIREQLAKLHIRNTDTRILSYNTTTPRSQNSLTQ
ncbi:MAG: peptidoglycan DD-metalloendopeptidase family protein [Gammaproteobacteria bacterium]|nr:peptidoglycan DD-metalloendopeptidase family protein [Gammaproteobacteria bacterium]